MGWSAKRPFFHCYFIFLGATFVCSMFVFILILGEKTAYLVRETIHIGETTYSF